MSVLLASKEKLYSYTYEDEERIVDGEIDEETGEAEQIEVTVRVYTIQYNGEMYFSDEVFSLNDEQKALASEYTKNLSLFLNDGCYHVIPASEFSDPDYCYDGVVFADGQTEVVYYNQYDERWRDLPYGTDNIGGYVLDSEEQTVKVNADDTQYLTFTIKHRGGHLSFDRRPPRLLFGLYSNHQENRGGMKDVRSDSWRYDRSPL